MSEPQRTYTRTALDNFRLNLTAPPHPMGTGAPAFGGSFNNNEFSFWVRTRVESDAGKGFLRASAKYRDVFIVLGMLKLVIERKYNKVPIEFYYGKPTDRKLSAKMVIAREQDESTGKKDWIYIGLINKDVTPTKFYFSNSIDMVIRDTEGNEFDPVKCSELAAEAWALGLSELLPVIAATNVAEENFQRGGRDNNQSYGQTPKPTGGYSSPETASSNVYTNIGSVSDDLPM